MAMSLIDPTRTPRSQRSLTAREGAALARSNLPYVAIAIIMSVLLSHLPLLNLAVYPFQLMATFVHESSHALVAMLTGGQVAEMVINSDLSGETYTLGGAALLIASAGYVGTALVGALLLLVRPRHARVALWGLAALAALAVISFHVTLYTAAWGALFAALCGGAARWGSLRIVALLQAFVAVQLGLNAVDALRVLGLYAVAGGQTDATNAAAASFLPPLFWTILWSLVALGALGGAMWRITFGGVGPPIAPGPQRPPQITP